MSCYSQDRLGWLTIVTTAATTMVNWYTGSKKASDTAFSNKLVSNNAAREAEYEAQTAPQRQAEAQAQAAKVKKYLTIGGVIVGGLLIGRVLSK